MAHHVEDLGAESRRRTLLRRLAAAVAVALLVCAIWPLVTTRADRLLTASFAATVGIYPNSDVRVLGVAVGSVTEVRPQGTAVEVSMKIRPDLQLPANAGAVVITPSLVADRYVQLTPAYTGGPEMTGSVIPRQRTATPVEIDQLLASLNQLMGALGPDGANKDGAVSDVLSRGAEYLDGNGKTLGEAIKNLGDLARTAGDSKDDLFGTVDDLAKFTGMLAGNNEQVKQAAGNLSSISKVLADQRDQFSGALDELTQALGVVQQFVRDNRGKVQSNVDKLADVTKALSDQKESLSEALTAAPNALTNLLGAYDPSTGLLDGRGNLLEFPEPK
ncbi:MCE family protein [Amycolatopsis jiangsuensis]|uniref:Virulence factor Mce-like protein n=1 Tax=Amycolatopsis jiangsuensis TaxID=1181879 RepID=A0A840J4Q6_9PSEU|nr:MCE family protein [Amycolatopsis jiangsuensis]MBB4688709.1 virulence factor Mce-like protein [Amycolatopsis jiangsuensis]